MTADLALRAAVLLAGGFAAARVMGRASAATRHTVWRLVLVAVLIMPGLTFLAPAWSAVELTGPSSLTWPDLSRETAGLASSPNVHSGARQIGRYLPAGMTSLWLAGVLTTALGFLTGYWRLWRLRRRSVPAPDCWGASAARLAGRLGLEPVPEVRVSPHVPGPIVAGLARPAIIIPIEAGGWPAPRREAVLVHELAHLRRRDLQAQFLGHVVCVLHWFNPLAWRAARAMRRERELACDDEVLRCGVAPLDYATDLLAIAAAALARRGPAAALSMARPTEMEGRLLSLLGPRPRRATRAGAGAACVGVVLASLTVAGATVEPRPNRTAPPPSSYGRMPVWVGPYEGAQPLPPGPDWHEVAGADDAALRARAAAALALTPGSDVVAPLLAALADADSRVREEAAIGLAWRRDPRIVPALLAAASDPDGAVREKVIVALAFSGDGRAREVVDAARQDPDPDVRGTAATLPPVH